MAKRKLKTKKKKTRKTTPRPRLEIVFSKGLLTIITLLIGFLLFNSFFQPKDKFQQAREKTLRNPNDYAAHLQLAEVYLKNNQFVEAEKELKLLSGFLSPEVAALWQEKFQKDPEEIRTQAVRWEELLRKYPDYRDGHLQLALLYTKLGEKQIALEVLSKVQQLAPNYKAAQELEKIISNKEE